MRFITDNPLYPSQYAEAYTGMYFTRCDTYAECQRACASYHIYISKGYHLTDMDKIPENANCVLVNFSTEEDYTKYDWRIMTIQKKYLSRFKKNLTEMYADTEPA